jgi:hypothetical protein
VTLCPVATGLNTSADSSGQAVEATDGCNSSHGADVLNTAVW